MACPDCDEQRISRLEHRVNKNMETALHIIHRQWRERDELLADVAMLRQALIGAVGGADTREELEAIEIAVRLAPAPQADKIASINVIHALLATMPQASPAKKESGQ